MTPSAGIGFKAEHYDDAMAVSADGLWFEVHAENYMIEGGPRLAMLRTLGQRFPLSIHGVGMSLAGAEPPEAEHLAALKRLVDRINPVLVSEHLAWSRLDRRYYPDLLPVPRTNAVLDAAVRNIDRVQTALRRTILIENPSHYFELAEHEWDEVDFLAELSRRSGCGLLVDVNNVVVAAHNIGMDPAAWLNRIPGERVGEIHVAGHAMDDAGELLIDSHDAPVSPYVWQLFEQLVRRIGPRPTLVERDAKVPPFAELLGERERAETVLLGAFAHV